jgi:hypothetical protein
LIASQTIPCEEYLMGLPHPVDSVKILSALTHARPKASLL